MNLWYGDSSALVKLYLVETGSAWLRTLVRNSATDRVATVELTGLELTSAIVRRARGGALSVGGAARALQAMRQDWMTAYSIIEVASPLLADAMMLIERYGLRGYDAVHLAAALSLDQRRRLAGLSPLVFLSADREQLRAAQAEGLATDDPNVHP